MTDKINGNISNNIFIYNNEVSNVIYYELNLEFLQKKGIGLLKNKELCSKKCEHNFYVSNRINYFSKSGSFNYVSSLHDLLLNKNVEELNKNPDFDRSQCICKCHDSWEATNCKCCDYEINYICIIRINDKMLDEINETLGGDIYKFQNMYYNTIFNNMKKQSLLEIDTKLILECKKIACKINNLEYLNMLSNVIENILTTNITPTQKIDPKKDLCCFDCRYDIYPDYNENYTYSYGELNKLTIYDFPIKTKYVALRIYNINKNDYDKDDKGNNYFHIRLAVLKHFHGRLLKYIDICNQYPCYVNFNITNKYDYKIKCITYKDDIEIFKQAYEYYKCNCNERKINISEIIKFNNVTRDLIVVLDNTLMTQIIEIIPNIIEINNNDILKYPSTFGKLNSYSISQYPIDDCP